MAKTRLLAGAAVLGVTLGLTVTTAGPAAAAFPIGYTVTANNVPIYRNGVQVATASQGDCFETTGGAQGWAYGVDVTINVNGSIQTKYLQLSGC